MPLQHYIIIEIHGNMPYTQGTSYTTMYNTQLYKHTETNTITYCKNTSHTHYTWLTYGHTKTHTDSHSIPGRFTSHRNRCVIWGTHKLISQIPHVNPVTHHTCAPAPDCFAFCRLTKVKVSIPSGIGEAVMVLLDQESLISNRLGSGCEWIPTFHYNPSHISL